MKPTHKFIGTHPAGRRGQACRIIRRSVAGRFLVVQFADGGTESCLANQVRRMEAAVETLGVECSECGASQATNRHLSFHSGICSECIGRRAERDGLYVEEGT